MVWTQVFVDLRGWHRKRLHSLLNLLQVTSFTHFIALLQNTPLSSVFWLNGLLCTLVTFIYITLLGHSPCYLSELLQTILVAKYNTWFSFHVRVKASKYKTSFGLFGICWKKIGNGHFSQSASFRVHLSSSLMISINIWISICSDYFLTFWFFKMTVLLVWMCWSVLYSSSLIFQTSHL